MISRTMRAGLVLASMLATAAAMAQTPNALIFNAQTVTGAGSVVPKLTWSTQPAAASCTASGASDWTGTKAASGTVTLAAITSSKTYQLVCTWPGDTTAKLTWVRPTQNTDGTALEICTSQTATGSCLRSFTIYHGDTAATMNTTVTVNDRNATTYTFTGLPIGPEFFAVRAVNGDGVSSDMSNVASKTLTAGPSATEKVAITVNPQPNEPTALTVE